MKDKGRGGNGRTVGMEKDVNRPSAKRQGLTEFDDTDDQNTVAPSVPTDPAEPFGGVFRANTIAGDSRGHRDVINNPRRTVLPETPGAAGDGFRTDNAEPAIGDSTAREGAVGERDKLGMGSGDLVDREEETHTMAMPPETPQDKNIPAGMPSAATTAATPPGHAAAGGTGASSLSVGTNASENSVNKPPPEEISAEISEKSCSPAFDACPAPRDQDSAVANESHSKEWSEASEQLPSTPEQLSERLSPGTTVVDGSLAMAANGEFEVGMASSEPVRQHSDSSHAPALAEAFRAQAALQATASRAAGIVGGGGGAVTGAAAAAAAAAGAAAAAAAAVAGEAFSMTEGDDSGEGGCSALGEDVSLWRHMEAPHMVFIQYQLAVLAGLVVMILICWRRHGSMISVLYAPPGSGEISSQQTP